MPELATPGWLLALLLLPLLRWLHRFRAGTSVVRVPALFLWAGSSASETGRVRGTPDPAWRRRALLAALVVLALSGPHWAAPSAPEIRVWVDDRPSLFAREADGRTRMEHAGEELAKSLLGTGADSLVLRALNRPGESLELRVSGDESVAESLRRWVTAPGAGPPIRELPPVVPGTERWLISDGAETRAGAFNRVLEVGEATENLALIRLAVRHSLQDPERMLGLLGLVNAGNQPAEPQLRLELDRKPLDTRVLSIAPGERRSVGFLLPAGAAGTLTAHLSSKQDALDLDDDLSLDLKAVAVRRTIDLEGNCPSVVKAAVLAHPGLRVVGDLPGDLRIWCGAAPPPAPARPTLWVADGPSGPATAEPPVWSAPVSGHSLRLRPAWIRPLTAPQGASGLPLLVSGNRPLILEQGEPGLITVLFDLEAPQLAARPELPALLALLLERLTDERLLFPTRQASRDATRARIAPGPPPPVIATSPPVSQPFDAAPLFLGAALFLLLADLLLLVRRAPAQ